MRDRLHHRTVRRRDDPESSTPQITNHIHENITATTTANHNHHYMQPADYDLIASIDDYQMNLAFKESMKTYIEETQ